MTWSGIQRVAAVLGTVLVVGLLAGCGSSGSGTNTGAQAQEQAQGKAAFCSSLANLREAVGTLTGLNPNASKDAYQSAVAAVQTAWQQVAAQAKALKNTSIASLQTAWTSFSAAVKAVPASDSVSESVKAISTQAAALKTATQTTIGDAKC
jgi:hypothetical protein